MNYAFFVRHVQPIVDIAFIALFVVVVLGLSASINAQRGNDGKWVVFFPLAIGFELCCMIVVKVACYYASLWQKTNYRDPTWHNRIRFIPLIIWGAFAGVFMWCLVLLQSTTQARLPAVLDEHRVQLI